MEDECVDDYGHGHAARLAGLVVGLAEQVGDIAAERSGQMRLVAGGEFGRCVFDALLKDLAHSVDARRGDGGAMGEHRQIASGAL